MEFYDKNLKNQRLFIASSLSEAGKPPPVQAFRLLCLTASGWQDVYYGEYQNCTKGGY